ncbi:MAG TPA: GFA family protein [Polyangiaceae bacterium]
MAEIQHTGGCHCGKVRYEVTLDLAEKAITCNCSMCGRSGTLLRFVPSAKFKLLSGAESLTSYRFNHKIIDHLFCSTCGIKSFATGKGQDGSEIRAVNVRCLDDVDVTAIPTLPYDGKSK